MKEKNKEEPKSFVPSAVKIADIYKPLGDSVVIEIIVNDKTAAGLYLPDQAREREKVQRVIAVGPDCKIVKPGNLVLVSPACRPFGVPLIYDENAPIQHIQVHEYELAGIVDSNYKVIMESTKLASTLVS